MVTQNDMDIQLLTQKVGWLGDALKKHMEDEEKERDRIYAELRMLNQKVSRALVYVSGIVALVSGGAQMLPLM